RPTGGAGAARAPARAAGARAARSRPRVVLSRVPRRRGRGAGDRGLGVIAAPATGGHAVSAAVITALLPAAGTFAGEAARAVIVGVAFLTVFAIAELWRRRAGPDPEVTRKFVH